MKLSKQIANEYGGKTVSVLWASYKADRKVYGKSFERFLKLYMNQLVLISIRNAVNSGQIKFKYKY